MVGEFLAADPERVEPAAGEPAPEAREIRAVAGAGIGGEPFLDQKRFEMGRQPAIEKRRRGPVVSQATPAAVDRTISSSSRSERMRSDDFARSRIAWTTSSVSGSS